MEILNLNHEYIPVLISGSLNIFYCSSNHSHLVSHGDLEKVSWNLLWIFISLFLGVLLKTRIRQAVRYGKGTLGTSDSEKTELKNDMVRFGARIQSLTNTVPPSTVITLLLIGSASLIGPEIETEPIAEPQDIENSITSEAICRTEDGRRVNIEEIENLYNPDIICRTQNGRRINIVNFQNESTPSRLLTS